MLRKRGVCTGWHLGSTRSRRRNVDFRPNGKPQEKKTVRLGEKYVKLVGCAFTSSEGLSGIAMLTNQNSRNINQVDGVRSMQKKRQNGWAFLLKYSRTESSNLRYTPGICKYHACEWYCRTSHLDTRLISWNDASVHPNEKAMPSFTTPTNGHSSVTNFVVINRGCGPFSAVNPWKTWIWFCSTTICLSIVFLIPLDITSKSTPLFSMLN